MLGNVAEEEVIWPFHSGVGDSQCPAAACKEIARSGGEGQVWCPPREDLAGYSRQDFHSVLGCCVIIVFPTWARVGQTTCYHAAICTSERGVWSMQEAGKEPKCAFQTSVYLMSHIIFSVSNLATSDKTTIQLGGWQSHQKAS